MKRLFPIVFLIETLLFVACLKPTDADFTDQGGLQDDEILWVLEIRQDSLMAQDSSQSDFFGKSIPLIFKDIVEGELPAYESFGSQAEPLGLSRINEKLRNLELSKSEFSSFQHQVELFSVVRTNAWWYSHEAQFLRLVSVDTLERRPPQGFVGVVVRDLALDRYRTVDGDDRGQKLSDWLQKEDFPFLPTYLRSNRQEYIMQSDREGNYLRKMVLEGNWKEIDWQEGQINVSGKERVELDPEQVLPFSGRYNFPPADSLSPKRELFLTAEKDYLVADWTHRFRVEKLLPYSENEFFSTGGELYKFDFRNDSLIGLSFSTGGDSLYGEAEVTGPF